MEPPQFYNKSELLVVESGALITYFNSNCDVMVFSPCNRELQPIFGLQFCFQKHFMVC